MSAALEAAHLETAPVANGGRNEQRDPEDSATAPIPLFVIPSRRGNGFRASIRGYLLELADPDSGHELAPTPDDLRTAALASDVAWFARRFLREHGLGDYVSVSVCAPTTSAPAHAGRFDVSVEVSAGAAVLSETLGTALEGRFAVQSPRPRFEVHAS